MIIFLIVALIYKVLSKKKKELKYKDLDINEMNICLDILKIFVYTN